MPRAWIAFFAAAALVAPAPAAASFPGTNGRVVFSSGGDLYTVLPDGSGLLALTATPDVEEAQAAWSPDGSRVAFRVGRPGTTDVLHVAVMNADGSGRSVITSGDHHSSQPGWSADGQRIIYRRSVPGDANSGDVWVMGADGSGPQQLVALAGDERYPSFSPDGRRLVYENRVTPSDDFEIYVAVADGSGAAPITDNAVFDSAPAWSPDSGRIAFERGPKGDDPGNDIWTASATGGDERQITASPGLDEGPAWSPDGTRIAFTSTRSGSSDIWSVGADGTGAALLAALPGGKQESPDWQAIPRPRQAVADYVIPSPPGTTPVTGSGGKRPASGLGGGGSACSTVANATTCSHDRDRDGLSDARERRLGTSPLDRDSDDDGLADGTEVLATHTNPTRRDTDRDGLTDGQERGLTRGVSDPPGPVRGTDLRRFRADSDPRTRTNPRRADSDGDGIRDGREDRNRNGRRDLRERNPLAL